MAVWAAIEADLIALFLILIMMFYGKIQERNWRELSIFNKLLIVTAFLCITDMLSWIFEGAQFRGAYEILHASTFLYNCSLVCIGLLWLIYSDNEVSVGKKWYRQRLILYMIPTACVILINAINIKTGWIFYYDSNNVYHRGELYFLHVTFAVLYLFFAASLVFFFAGKNDKAGARKAYSLLGFIVAPAVTIMIQALCYGLSLIPFGITTSLLIIFVQQIIGMITKDHLTGLDNHRAFEKKLSECIQNRPDEGELFVMMIDANDFKAINDTFGHDVGDEALAHIASALRRAGTHQDYLARLGGDEFAIIGVRRERHEIEELNINISEEMKVENIGLPYMLSVSVGYEVYDYKMHTNGNVLFQKADAKMYENKRRFHAEGK